jgi:hypothetical protein
MADFSVINAALTRIGEPPITSLTGASVGGQNRQSELRNGGRGPPVGLPVETGLKDRATGRLDPDEEGDPPEPWTAAYQLPTDLTEIRTVKVAGMAIAYEVHGDKVLCDAAEDDDVILHYVWRAAEADWPAWFREGITRTLEGVFLRGIGERYREAQARDEAAEDWWRVAKNRDAQSRRRAPVGSPTLRARAGSVATTPRISDRCEVGDASQKDAAIQLLGRRTGARPRDAPGHRPVPERRAVAAQPALPDRGRHQAPPRHMARGSTCPARRAERMGGQPHHDLHRGARRRPFPRLFARRRHRRPDRGRLADVVPMDRRHLDRDEHGPVRRHHVPDAPGYVAAGRDPADRATWQVADFAFATGPSGRKEQPYLKFAAAAMTLTCSDVTGSITLTVSGSTAYFVADHVGTYIRYHKKACLITAVAANGLSCTATVIEILPETYSVTVGSSTNFSVGEVVEGSVTGAKGIVTAIPDGTHVTVVLTEGLTQLHDVGHAGRAAGVVTAIGVSTTTNGAVTDWDEQMFSEVYGYPACVELHRNRLLFGGHQTPSYLIASALSNLYNFNVDDGSDADAILEPIGDEAPRASCNCTAPSNCWSRPTPARTTCRKARPYRSARRRSRSIRSARRGRSPRACAAAVRQRRAADVAARPSSRRGRPATRRSNGTPTRCRCWRIT